MFVALSTPLMIVGQGMVAQPTEARSKAQHNDDDADNEERQGSHRWVGDNESHDVEARDDGTCLDVALAFMDFDVFLALLTLTL